MLETASQNTNLSGPALVLSLQVPLANRMRKDDTSMNKVFWQQINLICKTFLKVVTVELRFEGQASESGDAGAQ